MDLPPLEPLIFAFAAATVVLAAGWRPWSGGARPASGPWASAAVRVRPINTAMNSSS